MENVNTDNGNVSGNASRETAEQQVASAIRFEALEPRVLLSGDVNPAALSIAGTLAQPGQQNHYQFTVQANKHVVFDSLTNRSDISWTLTGPDGQVASHQFSDDNQPFLDLTAGTYTLTVNGTKDATGNYAMRIVDASAAATLDLGKPVSATLLEGNEINVYHFDATAGQKFYFSAGGVHATDGSYSNVSWRLIDPYGRQEGNVNNLTQDQDTFAVQRSGEYLLMVEGAQGNTAPTNYDFTLNPVTDTQNPLALDDATNGAITQVGQTANYNFTLDNATSVLFDRLDGAGFNWSLSGPTGQLVQSRNIYQEQPGALNLAAGSYTLSIRFDGSTTGKFAFRLLSNASATTLSTDTSLSDSLDYPTGSKLYKVSLLQGQKLYLDGQTPTGGSIAWHLLDPYGVQVTNGTLGQNTDPFTVAANGDYWLVLQGSIGNAASATVKYGFELNSVPDVTAALGLNTTIQGTIAKAGESTIYSFHLAAATQLAFDTQTSRNDILWSLAGPNGALIQNRPMGQSDGSYGVVTAPAGDYTLTVNGSGAAAGAYAFALNDLAAAEPLTLGSPFSGTLTPGNGMTAYRFVAAAGDNVKLHSIGVKGGNATWRLVDQYGRDVAGATNLSSDSGSIQLAVGGTYTLLIEGASSNTAPVAYQAELDKTGNVAPTPLPAGDALTLGTTTTGTLATWNATKTYRFTLKNASQLIFNSTSTNNVIWTLAGPRGTEFNQTSIAYGRSILTLPAGDYALTLQGSASTSFSNGAYAFSVTDVSTLPSVQLGQATTVTRTPGTAMLAYHVQASAGSQLVLNTNTQGSWGWIPTWELVDAYGHVLPSHQGDTVGTVFAIPADGNYTLLDIGSRWDNEASATDTFTLSQATTTTAPLHLNDLASGSLAGRQSLAQYTFTLASPGTLVFDPSQSTTTQAYALQWLIRSSSGATYGWNGFAGSHQFLPAGQYTLLLRNTQDTPATYGFRISSRDVAQSLTLDAPVQASIASDQSTIYRFDAKAGDQYYFQNNPSNQNLGSTWNLVAPDGTTVASGNSYYANQTLISLTQTGEYLLVFSPNPVNSTTPSSGDVTFTLGHRIVTPAALTLGTSTSGNITKPGQRIQYSFTLSSPETLLMNPAEIGNNLQWSLSGPRGAEATSQGFSNGPKPMALPAGEYTLTIGYSDLSMGAFNFSLGDAASLPALPANQQATAHLTTSDPAQAWSFSVPSDGVYHMEAPSTGSNVLWTLWNNQGQQVQTGWTANQANQPFDLAAGQYFLSWNNPYTTASGLAVDFTLRHIETITQPLTLGTSVSGSIGSIAQRQEYDFAITTPTRVLFDSLSARSDINWQLIGPDGSVVGSSIFNNPADSMALSVGGGFNSEVQHV